VREPTPSVPLPTTDVKAAKGRATALKLPSLWRAVVTEGRHLLLVLAWVVLLNRGFGAFVVEGASMEPTLANRALVIVDTIFTTLRPFHRGDVVVFRYPRNPTVEYVKRVIALPGETVMVAHGYVFVDGKPLNEPYLREPVRYFWGPAKVPEGSVFVLGDNRNSSSDSHVWGPLPVGYVVGRAWVTLRPFSILAFGSSYLPLMG
jgi:signal peptidase I